MAKEELICTHCMKSNLLPTQVSWVPIYRDLKKKVIMAYELWCNHCITLKGMKNTKKYEVSTAYNSFKKVPKTFERITKNN